MKLAWKQKFKTFHDFLFISHGCFPLYASIISILDADRFYLFLVTYKFTATPWSPNLDITGSATHKDRDRIYKISKGDNQIGPAWASVNQLTNQLCLRIRLYSSKMTASGLFLWICASQYPLKDGIIPQRNGVHYSNIM